jgi:hypothetical protein
LLPEFWHDALQKRQSFRSSDLVSAFRQFFLERFVWSFAAHFRQMQRGGLPP